MAMLLQPCLCLCQLNIQSNRKVRRTGLSLNAFFNRRGRSCGLTSGRIRKCFLHVVLIAGAVGVEDFEVSGGASLSFGVFALCAGTASSPALLCTCSWHCKPHRRFKFSFSFPAGRASQRNFFCCSTVTPVVQENLCSVISIGSTSSATPALQRRSAASVGIICFL